MDFASFTVVDLGALADEYAHRNDRTFFHDHAFDDFRSCADKAIIFNDGRVSLNRLKHAADADPPGQVDVLADLGAGTDRGPGIDHGSRADVRADVDEARHEHDIARDVRAAPYDRTGHDAGADLARDFRDAVGENAGVAAPLRFGSWAGGDMDGNPNVGPTTIAETLRAKVQPLGVAVVMEVIGIMIIQRILKIEV